jgi:hypothetical protein
MQKFQVNNLYSPKTWCSGPPVNSAGEFGGSEIQSVPFCGWDRAKLLHINCIRIDLDMQPDWHPRAHDLLASVRRVQTGKLLAGPGASSSVRKSRGSVINKVSVLAGYREGTADSGHDSG